MIIQKTKLAKSIIKHPAHVNGINGSWFIVAFRQPTMPTGGQVS